jgi:proline iminopeptidase
MKQFFILCFALLSLTSLHAQFDETIFDKFTSTIIEIDGYKINVEVLGKGDPIFFFAGGPGSGHDYMQGHFGQYYKTNQVVFIDFLGRGMSDDAKSVDEYSIDNDVHVTEEVRKALGLDKISVAGHSYGTVPAQAYAIKYPENVNRMILLNGFHSGEMWQANCDSYNHYSMTHFPEKWKTIDSLRDLGYVSSDSVFMEAYGSLPTRYIYYHNTKMRGNYPKARYRGFNSDVYYAIIGRDADFFVSGSMIDTDFRRQLKELDIPTLIVAGRYDGVSTPEYAIQYKEFMPQAEFVMFEDSGHNPYIEESKKFYTILDDFLKRTK